MQYYVDDQGIHYYGVTSSAEIAPIDQQTALATLERIAAELETLEIILPTDEQKIDIWARIMDSAPTVQCECEQMGIKKCGGCG